MGRAAPRVRRFQRLQVVSGLHRARSCDQHRGRGRILGCSALHGRMRRHVYERYRVQPRHRSMRAGLRGDVLVPGRPGLRGGFTRDDQVRPDVDDDYHPGERSGKRGRHGSRLTDGRCFDPAATRHVVKDASNTREAPEPHCESPPRPSRASFPTPRLVKPSRSCLGRDDSPLHVQGTAPHRCRARWKCASPSASRPACARIAEHAARGTCRASTSAAAALVAGSDARSRTGLSSRTSSRDVRTRGAP